jgi:hypothetical protein
VASRCLFGVDLNPMAVQLTRLSLWLTTLAADRPLSFLDHHLVVGNSLIGATPIDLAAQAPGGRIRPGGPGPLDTLLRTEHMLSAVLPVRKRLESDADDTVDVVRDKERALRRLDRIPDLERWRIACDLWCAAWFDAGPVDHRVSRAVIDDLLGRYSSLPAATLESAARAALGIVGQQHPCHWPLAFPEVFVDASGKYAADAGFDAVVGNPPWEMLRREPGTGEGRAGPRRGLLRFTRESGVYRTPPRGHVNLYHLFVERALFLARSGGRVGLVVPMGLLTDESSGVLRRRLFDECLLDGVIGFDNRRRIFPIHRSVRFALLTASTAGRTDAVGCRLGETDADVLDRLDPESGFTVTVTRNLLERVSGPDLAVPHLQTREDLVLTERLYARLPALGASAGWQARFSRELNATEDRELFRRGDAAVNGDLPVVEGRHLSPFRVDLRGTTVTASAEAVRRRLGRRDFTRRPRLAYRDVAGAANRQTLIAAVLPAGVVSVHTVFCLRNALPAAEQDLLCALLNSYVANYLVRQRVSTHVTTAILNRIPVPRPSLETALGRELATRSAALRTGDSRPHAMAAIQADAARAWSLTSRELQHVLTTFPLIADAEKQLVLDSFSRRTRQ